MAVKDMQHPICSAAFTVHLYPFATKWDPYQLSNHKESRGIRAAVQGA